MVIQFDAKWLAFMRELFPKGTEIRCANRKDHIPALAGKTGIIEQIDDAGLFHCSLEDGGTLAAAIDEGCFQVNLREQTAPANKESLRFFMERGGGYDSRHMAILNAIDLCWLPRWAPDILFPLPRSAIVPEVNKDTFWELIAQAKAVCGQNLEASAEWIRGQLLVLGPEQVLNFDNIRYGYSNLAYQYGLWTAASFMLDGCTDDGFIDFRGWLIAQGRDVYMAALKDPDTLADVPLYGGGCFESLAYIGDNAYERMTGKNNYDCFDRPAYEKLKQELAQDIQYGEGIGYPYKWSETAAYLPRLCAKYLTPEDLAIMIRHHDDTWNLTSPEVRQARETASKGKKKKDRGEAR